MFASAVMLTLAVVFTLAVPLPLAMPVAGPSLEFSRKRNRILEQIVAQLVTICGTKYITR
jgi:hypothetical protein